MISSCDLPGGSLTLSPDRFPDPQIDLPPATGSDGAEPQTAGSHQTIVLAGGCFWCVEAVFKALDGVLDVTSGYAGGTAETADYHAVCGGKTSHAEVVRVRFDPARVSLGQILKVFFSVAHDPTQLDRQGNDRGRQYRSAVFYADDAQLRVAQAYIRQMNEAGVFKSPIVTCLEPITAFYEAEDYHQDYAARNPGQPYIAAVAAPKVEKLQTYFADRLKKPAD